MPRIEVGSFGLKPIAPGVAGLRFLKRAPHRSGLLWPESTDPNRGRGWGSLWVGFGASSRDEIRANFSQTLYIQTPDRPPLAAVTGTNTNIIQCNAM